MRVSRPALVLWTRLVLILLTLSLQVAAQGSLESRAADISGDDDCVEPPAGILGWWPLDEFPGGNTAEDLAQDNDGFYVGDPIPDFGAVGGSLNVSGGYVEVPHDNSLNVGDGDFTIELWVDAFGVVMSKHDGTTGYEVLYDPFLGLAFRINSSGLNNCGSLSSLWGHIAIVVDRDSPTSQANCYLNGVLSGTYDLDLVGSVDNTAPLNLGADSFGSTASGRIDEVTLYGSKLTAAEIAAIADAGPFGKCKEGGYAPWDKPMCLVNEDEIEVRSVVCNYHSFEQTYDVVDLQPLPTSFHQQCNIAGPTDYEVLNGPVTVPGGECAGIDVRIQRPIEMIANGQVGCYELTFENTDTTSQFSHAASLWSTDNHCSSVNVPTEAPMLEIEPERAIRLNFEVVDTGGGSVPFEVQVVPSDMIGRNEIISINGGRPGEPMRGKIEFGRDREISVPIYLQATGIDPFGFYDVLLISNPGSRDQQVLQSTGLRAVAPERGSSDTDFAKPARETSKP